MLLVTGGSGCGKSSYAEKRIQEFAAKNGADIYYLATMQVYGDEGRKKVQRHIELRRGKGMITIEKTRNVQEAIPLMEKMRKPREVISTAEKQDQCVILEDLGNLVANEMFLENGEISNWQAVAQKVVADILLLDKCVSYLVLVTNNVFEDGISYEEGTRNYQMALGKVNASLAREALEVVEVVVGIPQTIKSGVISQNKSI